MKVSDYVAEFVVQCGDFFYRCIPYSLIALLARYYLFITFFTSGQKKLDNVEVNFLTWTFSWGDGPIAISDSTYWLFDNDWALPLVPATLSAPLATLAELTLPVLILFGFFTRLSALALIGMTCVIAFWVFGSDYTTYPLHAVWFAALLTLLKFGPGTLSLDKLFGWQS